MITIVLPRVILPNVQEASNAIRGVLGELLIGIITGPDGIRVHLADGLTEAQESAIREIIQAVNLYDPTPSEILAEEAAAALDALKDTIGDRIAWHKENPVVDAVTALAAVRRIQAEWVIFLQWKRSELS